MAKQERCVWVVGHKNPDTDSICAAISYAYLKNQTEDGHFIAKRAGSINNETRYVLERFGAKVPRSRILTIVRPRVSVVISR